LWFWGGGLSYEKVPAVKRGESLAEKGKGSNGKGGEVRPGTVREEGKTVF